MGGVGSLLRDWRVRQHMSQLALALRIGISQLHMSFVEAGRSNPSRGLILRLAAELDIPLRERNSLLLAAGYAPVYPETSLAAESLLPVRHAIEKILSSHSPYPALVVDRCWDVVSSNEPVRRILADVVAPRLLVTRPNAIRVCLHPEGLASAIANFDEYAAHVLSRLRREAMVAPDHPVAALYDEVSEYPTTRGVDCAENLAGNGLYVPLRLRALGGQELSFISTIATFGTARDLTVAELSVESFFPVDKATDVTLRTVFG